VVRRPLRHNAGSRDEAADRQGIFNGPATDQQWIQGHWDRPAAIGSTAATDAIIGGQSCFTAFDMVWEWLQAFSW